MGSNPTTPTTSVPVRGRELAALAVLAAVAAIASAVAGPSGSSGGSGAPGRWPALLPPLVAIALAFLTREVLVSLAAGVWIGAWLVEGAGPVQAVLRLPDTHLLDALLDRDHLLILVFTFLMGGMIELLRRSGGAEALAGFLLRGARTRVGGQLTGWGLGLVVFFDDYVNSMLVGSTLRPVADRLAISREKLAFVIDATAAPVASLALVSSWIGVELGYIGEELRKAGIEESALSVFIRTLPFRFYPLLMIAFVALVILSRRDFGPMLAAERRTLAAHRPLEAEPAIGASPAAWRSANALLPIAVLIGTVAAGLVATGAPGEPETTAAPHWMARIGAADSLLALAWGAMLGALTAGAAALVSRALDVRGASHAFAEGLATMLPACSILVLAWALGGVCQQLETARFLVGALGGWLAPGLLPASIFLLSGTVSFATGTSWGTMAILFPLAVPLATALAPADPGVLLGSIAAILAGSVWGDHCSPLADTTILSSGAAGCDHLAHFRTQFPYACVVGGVSVLLGDLATGLGLYPPAVGLGLGVLVLAGVLRAVGRRAEAPGGQ